nr:transporter substrate-binding domain-containing protein [Pseudodesulfovibrio sp.]
MHYIQLFLVCFFSSLLSCTSIAKAENFLAMAAPYPPYSISNGLRVEGISVTTLMTIMQRCGTPISNQEIKLAPWAYAYECTARTPQRIILNAVRTPKTEQLYKWVGPIATSKVVLIGRKKDKFLINTKSDLKGLRIATVRWSRPEKALLAGGINANKLHRSPAHVQALRKLSNGEVDLFAFTEKGAPYLMDGLGMMQDDYTICYTFDEQPLYFAFSKDTDDSLISQLNKELKTLKATGASGQSQFDILLAEEIQHQKTDHTCRRM